MNAAQRLVPVAEALLGPSLPIQIRLWDGSQIGPPDAPALVVRSPRALRRLLWHPGELGLAQAYVSGEIDVEGDLTDGLRRVWSQARQRGLSTRSLLALAPQILSLAKESGALGRPLPPPRSQARIRGQLHTSARDKAAIAHHYDLSNDFYELVLDPQMAYSCAYFTHAEQSLESAQKAKLDLVCGKLELQPGNRLLDVGCGWGSLSIHAAQHFDVQVTGITLSAQQAAFVRTRVQKLGLEHRITIKLLDYRDLAGEPFDAVASLEMGEHVGQANYPVYAQTLRRMVVPGGRVLVQQMSRSAGRPGGGAFIEAYIAPDMHMRPLGETVALLEQGGLEVLGVQALREHYVRTAHAWSQLLEQRWDEVVARVGEEMARVWRIYLAGGALAFEEGRMGVDQILAVRADSKG
ncbi:SAM-dependent methyltransferase [Kineosporia babensis]|uniref:Cyclopropane-fatty-acyl-phospholipid synthase family protein n=1 Tax=Kineosporia babensis TaxID=499548 RepID=A0A9X1NGR6_9ACTN|nr:cyclopropane-fatty-acyl-phospholipid synthase family protein [Kineosporia babensis]MCD5313501.1 cyclopropane-fatty-acyl-phospholipid synthase family protein [Kineosporia babensis]